MLRKVEMARIGGSASGSAGLPLGARISLFFAALFVAYGVVVPYFPVWLDARGLSPAEIAVVTAAPLFLRVFFTTGVGLIADRVGNYRLVIVALAWSAVVLVVALSLLWGFWPILLIGVAFLLCIGTMLPLVETVAVTGVRTAGLDYGRMRLWGSLTFIVANFAGGVLIEALGGGFGIWLIATATALTVAAAHLLPVPKGVRAPAEPRRTVHWRTSLPMRLLDSRIFLLFLVAIGCTHGAHATFYTFGALHWQSQGLSAVWVGTLWAIGVTAEVILFALSAPVVRRFGPAQLILAGAGASVVRWGAMAFDPPLALLVPLQALHALTYGAAHLGAILFITRAIPHNGMGSAQSFYAVMAAGLVLGLVGLASGAVYASWGGAVYILPTGVALVGCAAGAALVKGWGGGLLWSEELPPLLPSPTAQPAADGSSRPR